MRSLRKVLEDALELPALLQAVLAAAANPDLEGARGRAPLHAAALRRSAGAVSALLAAQADPNLRSSTGRNLSLFFLS